MGDLLEEYFRKLRSRLPISPAIERELRVMSDRIFGIMNAMGMSNIPSVSMDVKKVTKNPVLEFKVGVSKIVQKKEDNEVIEEPRQTYNDVVMAVARIGIQDEEFKGRDEYSGFPRYIIAEKEKVILFIIEIPFWKRVIDHLGLQEISNFLTVSTKEYGLKADQMIKEAQEKEKKVREKNKKNKKGKKDKS